MSNHYLEIIEKFDLKTAEVKMFDLEEKNLRNLEAYRQAYDFFLNAVDSSQQILFMQFVKIIQNFIVNNLNRGGTNQSKRNKNPCSSWNELFIFIPIDLSEGKVYTSKMSPNTKNLSFFCLFSQSKERAFRIFQTNLKNYLGLNIDTANIHISAHQQRKGDFPELKNLFFWHVTDKFKFSSKNRLSCLIPVEYYKLKNNRDKRFRIISEYVPYIFNHFKIHNELKERESYNKVGDYQNESKQLNLQRKKSSSAPYKIYFASKIKEKAKKIINREVSRSLIDKIEKPKSYIRSKVQEFSLELDEILKEHDLL